MASIKEVIDDFKESVGDNTFMYIAIGVGALFLINFLKSDSGSGSTYVAPTSYASYPDAVTNANVIIDTLQENIEYSEQNIKDHIDDQITETNTNINSQFDYLNNYMQEGLAKQEELSNKIYDTTVNGFGEIKDQVVDVNSNIDNLTGVVNSGFSSVQSAISSVQSSINNVQSSINNVQSSVDNVSSTVNKINTTTTATNNTVSAIKNTVTTNKSASTSTNVGSTKNNSKTIKTSYTGNSIVDGLKAAGVNSSYAYRSQLAKANGITNYTGSASQNTALLNKLKKGTLKSV